MRWRFPGGWKRSLLSILAGNLIYFSVADRLPPALRHARYQIDLGLLVDFLLCVGVFWLSYLFFPPPRKQKP